MADDEFGDGLGLGGVLVQPQAEGVLDDPGDEHRAFARGEALLGLARKLRLHEFGREHIAQVLDHIVGGEPQAPGNEVAELAELAHGVEQAGAQAADVGAAQWRGNQVDIAFADLAATFGQPLQGPVDGFVVALHRAGEGFRRHGFPFFGGLGEIVPQPVQVLPGLAFRRSGGGMVDEMHFQARAQHGFGAQGVFELGNRNPGGVEVGAVGHEVDAGAGVALPDFAGDGEARDLFAAPEKHLVDFAAALDFDFEVARQRVDHGYADPMQAAGELVVAVGKLGPGVEPGEDQLDAADAFLRVDVHRHAAAVVADFDRAVAVEIDGDFAGMARKGLIDAVVDDFLHEVIRPGDIGVHARALSDRVEPGEHFDGVGVIAASHSPGFRLGKL